MTAHTSKTLTSLDGTQLYAPSWVPDGTPRAQVALIHGWSDHSGRFGSLVETLNGAGIAVHAVDLRGHGQSAGQRGHVNAWADYRNDIRALLDSLDSDMPTFLFGHSMGGMAVLDYVIHHPDNGLRGLITSAPLLSPPNVSPVLLTLAGLLSRIVPTFSLNPGANSDTLSRDPAVAVAYDADPLCHSLATARLSVEMENTRQFVLANVDAVKLPYLLFYGSADELVPPDMSRVAFEDIGAADKTRNEYEGGYHELMNDINKDEVLADVLAWLKAHL